MKSKYVRSWAVTLSEAGLYTVVFNVTQRGLRVDVENEETYEFYLPCMDTTQDEKERTQIIDPIIPGEGYTPAVIYSKTQILVVYIPTGFIGDSVIARNK